MQCAQHYQGRIVRPPHLPQVSEVVPLPSSSPPSSGEEGGASTPEGLSMADRGLLGAVWAVSALYGVLSDQMLSRQADMPCSVRVDPARGLGLASVVLAILVPTVVGPLAVTLLHLLLTIAGLVVGQPAVAREVRVQETRGLCTILLLTVTFLLTYTTSMVACEAWMSTSSGLLGFVVVKYVVGTSQHLLGPLAILLSRPDLRKSAVQVTTRKPQQLHFSQLRN